MIAVEEYTAHHSESLHTIMYEWGWRTFEGMFKRHLLRKAREELRQMRDLRVAALDANMNFDSKENQQAKESRIESIYNSFMEAERILYGGQPVAQETPMEEDPLFAPVNKRAVAMHEEASQPLVEQAGMGRVFLESAV